MIVRSHTPSRIVRFATIAIYLQAGLILISIVLAVLPADWIGHPYLLLAEKLNSRIDAPDNWAIAFVYFLRINFALVIGTGASFCVALWSNHRNSTPALVDDQDSSQRNKEAKKQR